MRYARLTEDAHGVSSFDEVEVRFTPIDFAPPAGPIAVSNPEQVRAFAFLTLPAGWNQPTHRAPRRQTVICLAGRLLVEASDGETREFGPGDVWRMEDVDGHGHHSRVVSEEDFVAAVVQFD